MTRRAAKYGNTKTVLHGLTFDSKAEARRYGELMLLERAGHIKDIKRQVVFQLAPGVLLHGEKRKRPAVRYVADFEYWCPVDGRVVEDTKGMDTPMSRLKRHLMVSVFGINVRLTK